MTPEKRVQNQIFKFIRELNQKGAPVFCERRQAGGFSYKAGSPDLWFVYNGQHVEVEVKSETGKMSSMQETWKRYFEQAKVLHICCNDSKQFKEELKINFPDIIQYLD